MNVNLANLLLPDFLRSSTLNARVFSDVLTGIPPALAYDALAHCAGSARPSEPVLIFILSSVNKLLLNLSQSRIVPPESAVPSLFPTETFLISSLKTGKYLAKLSIVGSCSMAKKS